jgi:hypothetical protein
LNDSSRAIRARFSATLKGLKESAMVRFTRFPIFLFKHIAPGKYFLHMRQAPEKDASNDQAGPIAWDAVNRVKLRREAASAKNEIELKPCQRVKDYVLRR